MAKSCALVVVGLVLATLCVANAGRIPADSGRKLIVGDLLDGVLGSSEVCDLRMLLDMTRMPARKVQKGRATLMETVVGAEDHDVVTYLEAGKVNELIAANVKVHGGVLHLRLEILGVNKVIKLDLAKLKAVLVGGELKVVVVLVLDEAKKVVHLQDEGGHCLSVHIGPIFIEA